MLFDNHVTDHEFTVYKTKTCKISLSGHKLTSMVPTWKSLPEFKIKTWKSWREKCWFSAILADETLSQSKASQKKVVSPIGMSACANQKTLFSIPKLLKIRYCKKGRVFRFISLYLAFTNWYVLIRKLLSSTLIKGMYIRIL